MDKKGIPLLATVTAIAFLIAATVLILFSKPGEHPGSMTVIGLIVTTIPSLIAAAFAERASRDIRNGVVEEKAKEGAKQALDEKGVTEVVEASQRGATTVLAMQALTRLLETNTEATIQNTESRKES